MMTDITKILKGPCENVSSVTGVDEYSKKIDLLEHTLLLVNGAVPHLQSGMSMELEYHVIVRPLQVALFHTA